MPTFQGQVSEDDLLKLARLRPLARRAEDGRRAGRIAASTQTSAGSPLNPGAGIRRSKRRYDSHEHSDTARRPLRRAAKGRATTSTHDYGALSWLLTKDHKRIAILYLFSITALFILGGFFAMVMRIELLTPEGDLLTSDTYNKFFTLHGIVMIFFFLIPSIPAVLGNFLLPLMLGAKDLAFPKINLLSWYLYMIAAVMGLVRHHHRRRRHRLDVLHAVLDAVLEHARLRRRPSPRSSSASRRS